jgi:hypothetical protein
MPTKAYRDSHKEEISKYAKKYRDSHKENKKIVINKPKVLIQYCKDCNYMGRKTLCKECSAYTLEKEGK